MRSSLVAAVASAAMVPIESVTLISVSASSSTTANRTSSRRLFDAVASPILLRKDEDNDEDGSLLLLLAPPTPPSAVAADKEEKEPATHFRLSIAGAAWLDEARFLAHWRENLRLHRMYHRHHLQRHHHGGGGGSEQEGERGGPHQHRGTASDTRIMWVPRHAVWVVEEKPVTA
jgi:hypothetical protein